MPISADALECCASLENAACPASLIAIGANAFLDWNRLRQITFAAGPQLQYISSGPFSKCPLKEVLVRTSVREIDTSALSDDVWRDWATFEGRWLFLIDDRFILSVDSRIVFRSLSCRTTIDIASNIEVIGLNPFQGLKVSTLTFESGTSLSEILGDRCFGSCYGMRAIRFEGLSKLKRIGERDFLGCQLDSITITALTEEIDGSAFVTFPLFSIGVASESPEFKSEGNFLVTSDGAEIVRYFGLDR